ncbi:hypothetical protein IV203_032926 [Nitzschia inconspicua]|uniref:Transmembrane protein n=1 Tax=Nitzschia inconspicua TaxID=303405 RepID=A0A9K3KKI0_9STRA|nr:hypothetical protein IV203_032926 [Nitzschia inconspicua]
MLLTATMQEPLLKTNCLVDRTPTAKSYTVANNNCEMEIQFSGGLLGRSSHESNERIATFLQGCVVGLVMWPALLWAAFRYTPPPPPPESFERLEGPEKHANITVLFLLLYTNISRILRVVIRDRGFEFVNSEVMIGSITVQAIATISVSLMIFFPTPVVVEPATGIRTHLVRWCEWTVVGFLMTFLTESVDMSLGIKENKQQQQQADTPILNTKRFPIVPWLHGLAIGISTSAGALSSFCTTKAQWWTVIGISWFLLCSLFLRLYQRFQRLKKISPGNSVEEMEEYDRAKYSLKTTAVCTVLWTGLASSWTVISIVAPHSSSDNLFYNPALMLVTESFFEALFKIWYADMLIEIHNIVFDDASRTIRRLEELRSLMGAV